MEGRHRVRTEQIKIWATSKEKDLIKQKMALMGITNMGAYIRKMAIDGYIINLDLSEINELISLQRRISNNINQIAAKVNSTDEVSKDELERIEKMLEEIWTGINSIIQTYLEFG